MASLYLFTSTAITFNLCDSVATIYRNYEEGKQRQVEKLGAGKSVDGSINVILDSKAKKEYEYFE